MFDVWALEEMGLPRAFTEILVSGLLGEPLALLFRNGYAVTRCKQLLYALRHHRCPGAFRISQWGFILVIIPSHKPTPASLENILMLRVPLKGDEWYREITKILRGQSKLASSAHLPSRRENLTFKENLQDIFREDEGGHGQDREDRPGPEKTGD